MTPIQEIVQIVPWWFPYLVVLSALSMVGFILRGDEANHKVDWLDTLLFLIALPILFWFIVAMEIGDYWELRKFDKKMAELESSKT